MKLKEFIETKPITGFEIIGDILINVISESTPYGLDSDTSSIQAGTLLEKVSEYTIIGDILIIKENEYDITTISLL